MGRLLGRRAWQANAGPKAVKPENDGPDLINYNAVIGEWENKHKQRNLRSLALFREAQAEAQRERPWASLSELRPGHGEDPDTEALLQQRRPATGSVPPRSPQPSLRPSSSSALSATSSRPPRTSSTTLTSVWRRALATPEPGSFVDEYGVRRTKEWEDLYSKLSKDELVDLVEHVHSKVVAERRRRKELMGA
mmetsp:Transcript_31939/g.58483  ORF Transcript_31939/g.58483 Transcript_31939/m.58483 type:complete len:193 (+) Transcript_31939:72-650(+)